MGGQDLNDRMEMYRRGLAIRAIAAGAFGLFFFGYELATPGSTFEAIATLTLVLGALVAVNPVLWAIGVRRGFPIADFYAHWVGDVFAVTVIVYCLGVFDVPLAMAAYLIMIVSSASFATMATSLLLAVVSSVCFAGVAMLEAAGVLRHWHVAFAHHPGADAKVFYVGAAVLLFVVFGYLAGALATQLQQRAVEISEQKAEVVRAWEIELRVRREMLTLSMLVRHDVYGPLAAISGACDEAARALAAGENGAVKSFLTLIENQVRSVGAVLATLDTFTAGDEAAVADSYSLLEIVEGIEDEYGSHLSGKGVRLVITGRWPRMLVPRSRVAHVFRNLVGNALKSVLASGGSEIGIDAAPSSGGGWVVIVTDDGAGIPEDRRDEVLSKAVSNLNPAQREAGGFGAGLALCRNLAASWGGAITYSDRRGGGAVFSVSVPESALEQHPQG